MSVDLGHLSSVCAALVSAMLCGFFTVKFNFFPWEKIPAVNKYNFQTFLFVLLYKFPAYKDLKGYNIYPFIVVALSHIILHLLFAVFFFIPDKNLGKVFISTLMPATYVNYITIGIPVFRAIWGNENIIFVSMMILCNETVISPMYILESGLYNLHLRNKSHDAKGEPREKVTWRFFWNILKTILISPINLSMVAGLIFAIIGKGVPKYFERIVKIGADGVLCVTLFCIGGFVASHNIFSFPIFEVGFSLLLKFFIFPIINCLVAWAIGLDSQLCRCCAFLTTLPCVFSCFFVGESNGYGSATATAMIAWSMILFLPILLIWIEIFDYLKLFV